MYAGVCPQWCLTQTVAHQVPLSMEILQARILEWVAISSSRESSWPRDQTQVSSVFCIGRQVLYQWATWEAPTIMPRLLQTNSPILQDFVGFGLFYTWMSPKFSNARTRGGAEPLTLLEHCTGSRQQVNTSLPTWPSQMSHVKEHIILLPVTTLPINVSESLINCSLRIYM